MSRSISNDIYNVIPLSVSAVAQLYVTTVKATAPVYVLDPSVTEFFSCV